MRKSRRRSRRTYHAEMRKSRKQSKRSRRMYRSAVDVNNLTTIAHDGKIKEIIDTLITLLVDVDSPAAIRMRTPVTDDDLNGHGASFQQQIANLDTSNMQLNNELRTVIRYFERLPVAMNDEMSEKVRLLLQNTRSSMEARQIQWRFDDVQEIYERRLKVFNDPNCDNLKVWRYILHCLQNNKFNDCIYLMARCNMNTFAAASSPESLPIRAPMANNFDLWHDVWEKLNNWLDEWLYEQASEHFHKLSF